MEYIALSAPFIRPRTMLQVVIDGYMWLYEVIGGCRWLYMVIDGYRSL